MAQTRLGECAGSSDHSLRVDGISTDISDIMNTLTLVNEFSKISDEKEPASLWSANKTIKKNKRKNLMQF